MSTSSSFLCADTAISSAVPPPDVTLEISDNKVPYVGNDIVLVCEIQLPGVVSASDVSVSVRWLKGGSEFSGVSGRVTVVTPTGSAGTVQSTVSFSPLLSSAQNSLLHAVPSLVVQTSPSSIRILNVSPYNQFTVTCTASAEVNGQRVPLEMTVEWFRRSQPSSGSATFSDISSTEYVTTGSPEDGYQSILNTTETDTENSISYRCRANNAMESLNWVTSDTTLEVVGMY